MLTYSYCLGGDAEAEAAGYAPGDTVGAMCDNPRCAVHPDIADYPGQTCEQWYDDHKEDTR